MVEGQEAEMKPGRRCGRAPSWGIPWRPAEGLLRTPTAALVQPLRGSHFSFPSNRSPYMEGEIGHVLSALRESLD